MFYSGQHPADRPVRARRRRRLIGVAAGLVLLATCVPAFVPDAPDAAAATAVIDLGASAPGRASAANGVNDLGVAVGWVSTSSGQHHAARWGTDGIHADLGTLGGESSEATAVNDAGVIVGWSEIPGEDQITHAFRWTQSGGLQDLGTLPGFDDSKATAINESGMIVGTAYRDDGVRAAVVWQADGSISKIPAPGRTDVAATDVNNAGVVVGFMSGTTSAVIEEGFRWSAQSGLEVLNAGPRTVPVGINDDGVVAGHMYAPRGGGQLELGVFRWTPTGGFQYLGGPVVAPAYGQNAQAIGVTADGTIVGYEVQVGSGWFTFKWVPSTGFTVLDLQGDPTPLGVSANGAIVGTTYRGDLSTTTAFLVPAPTFDGQFDRADAGDRTVRTGESTAVELTVRNTSGGTMTDVTLSDVRVESVGADGGDATLTATTPLDSTTLAGSGAQSTASAGFTLEGVEAGPVTLVADVEGTGPRGRVVGRIATSFTVDGDDLSVEVTLDPPIVRSADRVPGEPASVGITVKVANDSDDDVTNVTLHDLNVARVFSGQQLLYDFVDPGPVGAGEIAVTERPGAIDPVPLPDVPAHDSITLRARVEISTPGAFEVSAMVWGRGQAPTTLIAVGKAALTIESGLTVELDGVDGPTPNLVDMVATVENTSGGPITGLDWGDGLDFEALQGSDTLRLVSGPRPGLPSRLEDGEKVQVRWRFEVWNIGVGVSTLAVHGSTSIGVDVEAVAELSSTVTENDVTAADMQRASQLALSSALDRITGVGEQIERAGTDPPLSPGDQMRAERYQSYLDEGFSDATAKMLAAVSVGSQARERYLVTFAEGMNARAVELGDKFVADTKDLYGLLSNAERRNAAGGYLVDALKTNTGYFGDAFAIPNGEKARNIWNFWTGVASNSATALQQAAVGQLELWQISDDLYRNDPMTWASNTGRRNGAMMSDFNAAFTTELVSTVTGEGGAAALRAARRELGAGITALRASTVGEAAASSTVRAGGDDALGAATRQFAKAEGQVQRFQDFEYGKVLSRAELENVGGFSAADADAIEGIVSGVKDKFGVDIQMVARTAEPLSTKVAGGIGKRSYTKEKAVGELDKLLGAPDELGGRVTIFEPKPLSADQLAALEAREPGFTVRYQDRLKTQKKNWDALQNGTSKTGRLVEASEKYDGITIVQDLPGNPTQGVEYLEQLGDPSYVSSRGWTQEYADQLRTQLETHPSRVRAKLEFQEVDGAYTLVDSIDGTPRAILSDYDLQAVIPESSTWPPGLRGQIETYVKHEMDRIGRSGRHGWSAAANDLPSMNFDLAAEFIMNTAHPSVARQTAENLAGRFASLAKEFRAKAARLGADDPLRAQLLAKAADFEELTVDKIMEKWKSGEKTIVFSKGRVTVGSGEGSVP